MPPPNLPLVALLATVVVEMANGPVVAWMLARVGAGPRSNGLVSAEVGLAETMP